MKQRLQNDPLWKQHLHSLLLSVLCTETASLIALLYYCAVPEGSFNIPLLFLVAVIIVAAIALHTHTMASQLNAQEKIIAEQEKLLSECEAEKMRANLLRAISHDLRAPLAGIINNSSLLLERNAHLTETEMRKMISNIYEDSNWLLNMVENLLSITRIRGDTLSITTSEEAVEEVISEALQKLTKRYPDVQIHARVPEEFILLPMDAILIEQVTINLLTNAVLYSNSARPINLIVRDTPHAVIFTVRDYGTGLPPENMANLFDGAIEGCKGTGIGLSICKTIIAAHHGTLIGRNHTEGTEFIFTLPKDA